MKTRLFLMWLAAFALQPSLSLCTATTINAANHNAYGANFGWTDWRGDVTHGAVIGEYVCSGYIYAANVGWIHLGDGTAANGIQYRNNSGTDYGINHDGLGNLHGYAWGANIGWINFESTGAPRVNLATGRFGGYAYSANCGWISLSNAFAHVQTDYLQPGADTDGDGIVDSWELCYTNTLTAFNSTSDTDGDDQSDLQEAMADTDPLDPNDNLRITRFVHGVPGALSHVEIDWSAKPTRFYGLEWRTTLDPAESWKEFNVGFESILGWSNIEFDDYGSQRFYRIRAVKPLSP